MTVKEKTPEIRPIAGGVYLINEFDGTNCYLLAGSSKALLIDCGTGLCNYTAAVRSVTDLPFTVAATHGHVDHIGGAGQFDEVFVHRLDCRLFNRAQASVFLRRLFTLGNAAVKAHGIGPRDAGRYPRKANLTPFDDFSVDLGGKTVTAHLTPGHTKGSVAFIDEEDKLIFSGDNVCDALWLHLPGCTSVEEWLPSARWLYEKSADYRIFWGHRTPELTREYIAAVIGWGEEILQSRARNTILPLIKQYPPQSDGILYRTDRIFKKQ
ncbi:MAG: MBL fold metallo-hydrolase [Clostridia bacterium]|nr:MBL fold metallo-hydrolase [Clostridia bacterium]